MLKNIFKDIYIFGNGITAIKCAEMLANNLINFKFIKTKIINDSYYFERLHIKNIEFENFTEKIKEKLISTKLPTLIFSVNNPFIFPQNILENNNIVIINYHNSILPRHRGMNAEAWAIFEGDCQAGVTWHLVDEGIDTGPILFQCALPIHDDTTSITLLKEQSSIALNLLEKNLLAILSNNYKIFPNESGNNKSIHYKKQIPGDSYLDLNWPPEKIWRFLRAMDYGPYYNLGRPKIILGSGVYSWRGYSRKPAARDLPLVEKNGDIIINGNFHLHGAYRL